MKTIHIYIDGKKIEANEGANLLQTARDNGFDIPGLCYHKRISPTGACRLCAVRIEGTPGLVMSCTVPVKEGMKVTAFSDELDENRIHSLQYLLSEHNADYDGSYSDEFRELLLRYNIKPAYPDVCKEQNYPKDTSSPVLTYDASKCIKCFRCIKACQEIQGKNVLNFFERGLSKYIVAGTGQWSESECDGCGECVQLCPTGALVEKAFRSEIKVLNIGRKVQTTCPYCGVGCQLDLWVKGNTVVRVTGHEGQSPNDGRLCVKGRFGYHYINHPSRLKTPLLRKNGKLTEVSWEEAITFISEKLIEIKKQYGKSALAGYSSAKCSNEDNYIFQKFVRLAFGNNNVDYCTRLCHASTVTAMLRAIGDGAGSNSIEDFETTDCLLITGNNIIETHPITATYVKRGKAKGSKIIVIDPKWTPLVNYADVWLQPKLATDVALLNGMMHIIIKEGWINKEFIETRVEGGMQAFNALKKITDHYNPKTTEKITGVPVKKLREAAKLYALSPTAMIATGMGMSQQTVGTNNVFSLLNLCFITGQIGRERCGINPPRGQNNVQGATDVGASPLNYPGYIPVTNDDNRKRIAELWNVAYENLDPKPGLTTVEIMKAAHEKQIRALYIMGENPMITDPNLNHVKESLQGLDLLVVQDIFMTETAEYAHVVLPAGSFAEKDGTVVNSDRRVLRLRKAIDMPGEAREDWRILINIAEAMKVSLGSYSDASDIFDEISKAAPMLGGINYHRLENSGIQWPCPNTDHPGTSTLFLERFNTPTGKAKLHPVDYIEQSETASDQYPFILNSGRILYQYHSSTMSRKNDSLNAFAGKDYLLINPDDAKKLNIADGQKVQVSSRRGKLKTTARISDEVASGEVFMPWHFKEARVNSLTRDELDPLSKIAPFKYSAVNIVRI